MRLYSGSGRRLSGKKGGKRLAGGGKRLRSKGLGLAPVAGMLAIACCLGGLLWCVRAGFPNRPAGQGPDGSQLLFFPPSLSGAGGVRLGVSAVSPPAPRGGGPRTIPTFCFIRFTCRCRGRRKRKLLKRRLRKQRNRIPRRTGLCSALPATAHWAPSMTPGTARATSRTWWGTTTPIPWQV